MILFNLVLFRNLLFFYTKQENSTYFGEIYKWKKGKILAVTAPESPLAAPEKNFTKTDG